MTSQVDYDFSLARKVAVVTGGASGIGAAIVACVRSQGRHAWWYSTKRWSLLSARSARAMRPLLSNAT